MIFFQSNHLLILIFYRSFLKKITTKIKGRLFYMLIKNYNYTQLPNWRPCLHSHFNKIRLLYRGLSKQHTQFDSELHNEKQEYLNRSCFCQKGKQFLSTDGTCRVAHVTKPGNKSKVRKEPDFDYDKWEIVTFRQIVSEH